MVVGLKIVGHCATNNVEILGVPLNIVEGQELDMHSNHHGSRKARITSIWYENNINIV